MHVNSIVLYPIKSCKGIQLQKAVVDARGLEHDRSMMVVFQSGSMLTQRDYPQLALVQPSYRADGNLTLSAPVYDPLTFPLIAQGPEKQVSVWNHGCLAVDQGDQPARWFSDFLGVACRLVRIGKSFERTVSFASDASVSVGFSDHSPMVIATTAALNQLNQHLDEPTMISRFRANIIIDGCETNDEYSWDEIQIGDVNFEIVNDCARCSITAVTQETALPSLELLKTLATVGRRSDKKPVFGVHTRPTTLGAISLSSSVQTKASVKEREAIPVKSCTGWLASCT